MHSSTHVTKRPYFSELVYPGRLYVDLSKVGTRGGVDVVMMPRMSNQHPGVVTTKVQVSRITPTTGFLRLFALQRTNFVG